MPDYIKLFLNSFAWLIILFTITFYNIEPKDQANNQCIGLNENLNNKTYDDIKSEQNFLISENDMKHSTLKYK